MTRGNPKKSVRKRELEKDTWYIQMGQVGTGGNTWDKWDRDKGASILDCTG